MYVRWWYSLSFCFMLPVYRPHIHILFNNNRHTKYLKYITCNVSVFVYASLWNCCSSCFFLFFALRGLKANSFIYPWVSLWFDGSPQKVEKLKQTRKHIMCYPLPQTSNKNLAHCYRQYVNDAHISSMRRWIGSYNIKVAGWMVSCTRHINSYMERDYGATAAI